MAVEIERKFLLADERWREHVTESAAMRQGYLNREQLCSVRIRTSGDRAWLNIKSATIGCQRQEFEYPIPLADANTLLDTLCHSPIISKTRHYVPHQGHLWEIDEFAGDNSGLIVAEIELTHAEEVFSRPDWLGEEVTLDIRYYNTSLSRAPYNTWGKPGA